MKINFYDTRLTKDKKTVLVKEKTLDYETDRADNPKAIAKMMCRLLKMNKLAEEHCYMLALNNNCRIIGAFLISKGSISASILSPREIFMRALLIGSSIIVIIHNHPSENANASVRDIDATIKLKYIGDVMGIHLADHIIIGGSGYYSFKENGLLE